MALDPVKNFAISRVGTAPSPATSGTTLVVEVGDGVLFPEPATSGAYNVVIYPNGEQPTSTNAEIVRVTARTSDTMTITREQESTSARTIVEGDVVMLGITAKVVEDLNDRKVNLYSSAGTTSTVTLSETAANFVFLDIFFKTSNGSFDSVKVVSPNGLSVNLLSANYFSSAVYVQNCVVAISGTSITFGTNTQVSLSAGGVSVETGNYIYITRVDGYRDV